MSNPFSQVLIAWYEQNKRDLPWRHTTDPYKVWLSEIILQQTRVVQGMPYYEKFVAQYPTVADLAAADEQQVLRLWQGLGYYSRARNLHACAKMVMDEYDGIFPETAAELQNLKGIGEYTAAAIASFCFKEAAPVLDGNVFRVVARYFGISVNIADAKNKKAFYQVLEEVIDRERPDQFNQAIMEFGALHCTPAKPLCMYCDLRIDCHAYLNQQQQELPVKIKKLTIKKRHFQYLVFISDQEVFMKERGAKDIWQGLHDFYLIEHDRFEPATFFNEEQLASASLLHESAPYKHVLTHQRIKAQFYVIRIDRETAFSDLLAGMQRHHFSAIAGIPKPKLIDNYLNEVFFSLDL